MTLCDVNIYIYSFREDVLNHAFYSSWLNELLNSNTTFAYTELVLSSFLRIVTHTNIFKKTTPIKIALEFTQLILSHPMGLSIMPGARHWEIFKQLSKDTNAAGNNIPDIYLAALAIESEIQFITADKGFKKIKGLDCLILKP
jgi:hypothetical protein